MSQIRAIRIELVKPLDRSWEELKTLLFTQRKVMGQLVQAGVDSLVACEVVGPEQVKAAIAPKEKAAKPSGLAYQAVKRELEKIKEKGKWNESQLAALNIAASTLASISKRAFGDLAAWRAAQYRRRESGQGKKGRASYGRPQPIHLPKVSWSLEKDPKGFVLKAKLIGEGWVRVALHPRAAQEILKGIQSEAIPRHDCKLLYCERKGKWYAVLGYDAAEPAPVTIDPSRVLVVHRGMKNALTFLPSTGKRATYESGVKFMAQRFQLSQRTRAARTISLATLGSGSKGHGRARRSEHLESLEGKIARVTKTWCQQMGAMVLRRAKELGCGLILIESYGGIQSDNERAKRLLDHGPLYQLKEAIVHAVSSHGLHVEEVEAAYISTTCPRCLNAHESQHNRRTQVFHCVACGFERPADFVAALNMLRTSEYDYSLWERKLKALDWSKKAAEK